MKKNSRRIHYIFFIFLIVNLVSVNGISTFVSYGNEHNCYNAVDISEGKQTNELINNIYNFNKYDIQFEDYVNKYDIEFDYVSLNKDHLITNNEFIDSSSICLFNNNPSVRTMGSDKRLTNRERVDSFSQNNVYIMGLDNPSSIRQPAEFEPMDAVLIRYPFGIPYDLIAEMSMDVEVITIVANTAQMNYVMDQYQNQEVNMDHTSFLFASTNSYWTRDYGPWFIFNTDSNELEVVDFYYDRPRPLDDLIPYQFAVDYGFNYSHMGLLHEGGNYMTDGNGIAVSTDYVWTNNQQTPGEINQIINHHLGVHTYHVRPDVNNVYIQHIDCWAKYLSPDTIMIREVPSYHPQYDEIEDAVAYFSYQLSSYGTPYTIVRVYTPNNEPYVNSLILNDKVLVPLTGGIWDDDALVAYETAMPGYQVLGFYGLSGYDWLSTDALHCRTKGIPDRHMLYIEHTPLAYAVLPSEDGFVVEAKVISYSNMDLLNSYPKLIWKNSTGTWNTISMDHIKDDTYQAVIPSQPYEETITYYIHAQDASGRNQTHPFIGSFDPHSFSITQPPVLTIDPFSITLYTDDGSVITDTLTIGNDVSTDAILEIMMSCSDTHGYGWLSLDMTNASILPGSNKTVTVTVDTMGLSVGMYSENILIRSNDPDSLLKTIPVQLHATYDDDLRPVSLNHPTGSIYQGMYQVNATVQNSGSNDQTTVLVNCSIYEAESGGVIFEEDFSSYPSDWTITHTSGTAWNWDEHDERMENSYSGSSVNSGFLDTPVIDCSNKAGMSLSFWQYWRAEWHAGDQSGYIRGSIDGGITFPYLIDSFHHLDPPMEEEQKDYKISWADGQPSVVIRFDVYNNNDWYWYIDDVKLSSQINITGPLVYASEEIIDIESYEREDVLFTPSWMAMQGTYGVQVTTMLDGDENPGNDVIAKIVYVTEPMGPLLSFDPDSFDFGLMLVNATGNTNFSIWNSNVGELTYVLSESCDWVSLSSYSGSVDEGEVDTIMVYVDTTDLTYGLHTCEINISSNGGDGVFSVSVFCHIPPPLPVRSIAEWEPMEGVLIRYPLGIPVSLVALFSEEIEVVTLVANENLLNEAMDTYQNNGVNMDNCSFLIVSTNSFWTRDYGPLYIVNGDNEVAGVDYEYRLAHHPDSNQVPIHMTEYLDIPYYKMPEVTFDCTSNFMADGMGIAASSSYVMTLNPNHTQAEIKDLFFEYLGIESYHIVQQPPGGAHIDTWAKFLAPDKILIRQVPPSHSAYAITEEAVAFFESQISSYGTPYTVFRVDTPDGEPYTNSLILNNRVFVPIMGNQVIDDAALAVYETAMPGYTIYGIQHTNFHSGDALHCRTQEIPDRGMLSIYHLPIIEDQQSYHDYEIQAQIIPLSGEQLYMDSVRVYYQVDDGDFSYEIMTPTEDNWYTAHIPQQEIGSTISYYISASDQSGRTQHHPYIGSYDPHRFIIGVPLSFLGADIDDSVYGNDNGVFETGETVQLFVHYRNDGPDAIENLTIRLNSSSLFVSVHQPAQSMYTSINPHEEIMIPFIISSSVSTPHNYEAFMELEVEINQEWYCYDTVTVTVKRYIIEEVFIQEDFEQWLPDGWIVTSTSGQINWQHSDTNLAGGDAPEAQFFWEPSTYATQRLITPSIDTSAYTLLALEFSHYISNYIGGYSLRVETSGDGGYTWNEIMDFPDMNMSATMEEICIDNEDVGSIDFKIAFTFEGDSWNINWWNIDDVLVCGVIRNDDFPSLAFAPDSFDFGVMTMNATGNTNFSIWNSNVGTLSYVLSESCDWLSLSSYNGSVNEGDVDMIMVYVDTTDTNPGLYTCDISISSTGGYDVFSVSVFVVDATEFLDVEQELSDRGFRLMPGWDAAQEFVPSYPVLSRVELYMTTWNDPVHPIPVEIRKDDPIGDVVFSSVIYPADVTASFPDWGWVSIDTSVAVEVGETYVIVLRDSSDDDFNHLMWGVYTSFGTPPGPYPDGQMLFRKLGFPTWMPIWDFDCTFKTYGLG